MIIIYSSHAAAAVIQDAARSLATAMDQEASMNTTASQERPRAAPIGQRRISSSQLLAGSRTLLIEHAGELYQLRHTSKGKLILTK